MPKISVITPTIRPEGLTIVAKALSKQTFRDFEWIIITSLRREDFEWNIKGEKFDVPEITLIEAPPKPESKAWTLNRDYNLAIKEAKGSLIVSWQDWTYAKANTLEEFWKHYEDEPNTLVSAVGNKYESDSWDIMVWKDPRIRDDIPSYYPCYYQDIEWNLCAVPKKAIKDVGGFDEGLDKFYGMDGFSVNERIWDFGGYDFKLDQSIKSYSLPHGRYEDWDDNNAIDGPYEERRFELEAKGKWPCVGYLK